MGWFPTPFAPLFLALVLFAALAPPPAIAQQTPRPELSAESLIEVARAALAKGKLDDAEFLLKGVRPGEGDIDDLDFLHGTIAAQAGRLAGRDSTVPRHARAQPRFAPGAARSRARLFQRGRGRQRGLPFPACARRPRTCPPSSAPARSSSST